MSVGVARAGKALGLSKDLVGGFPGGSVIKNPPASAGRYRRCRFNPWVGKIPWRMKWQPTPVFLLGESHGQRSLEGYNPWGHKESGHN